MDLRREIYAHLQRLHVGFFDQNPSIDVAPTPKADDETCHTGTGHHHPH
jgi:ABC-type multidrug transport system fused ATPase/permease subunit